MPMILTQDIVEKWIELVSGTFNVRDVWSELDIQSAENKQHLRVILNRLEHGKIIVKTGSGLYRKIDTNMAPIDWQSANLDTIVPIELPFDIHKYAKLYPKSIVMVAGEKSEGKTTFMYETIKLNMGHFVIDLFNSETGPEQMKERFAPLHIPEPAPFNVYERYDNFGDVVHPEHLSVIDYLDTNSEVYLVGAEIDHIFRKLTTGVAIIGVQKPPSSTVYVKGVKKTIGRDLGYGGAFTAKRASIYVSLSSHKAKLVYAKTPVNKGFSANGMQWTYDFDDNGYFTNVEVFVEQPEF
jgi:hypothetical protein